MTAYVIFTRERTTDQSEMELYQQKVGAAAPGHAITPLVRYGAFEMLEGDPIEGAVVLSFPTMAEARAWYESPLYQEAVAHRHAGSDYRVFIIEGITPA
ncbi:DUF1330 domain-containing protein [Lichenicola sp.]|uniref:DUF1330 domain-containing protein n=1 Tax=Lichenicola sp. TaxID=2804529 RepID=UPI003B008BCB